MRRGGTVVVAVVVALGSVPAWAHGEPGDEAVEDAELLDDAEALDDAELLDDEAPVDDAEPADPEWADPEAAEPDPPPTSAAPSSTHDVPADDFEAAPGVAPGGYYGHGMILERPPPDGRNRIIVGSILVPLGTLATVTSAVGTWLTVPRHCADRLATVGIEADAARCQGLFTFNVIRTTYGVLMLGSGATILALGLLQRHRYRRWRAEHGMRARLRLEPGTGLRIRF